jgi:uncharacterized protein YukE
MRSGDGGGYAGITGNSYHIKTMAVTPASASGYPASEIEQLFSQLDPSAVAEAGAAHTAAAKTLASIADSLVTYAKVLSSNWSGSAAQASMTSFQQLHQTAIGLAQAAAQTGATLTWLGQTILPYYKNYKAPGNGIVGDVESLFGDNPADKAAQAVMERLNDRLSQANAGLPASVTQDLPKLGTGGHSNATTGGIPAGSGAGAAASGVGLAGGAGGGVRPAGGPGGGVTGVTPGGAGPRGGVGGVRTPGRVPASPGAPTHLAGLPPAGGTTPGVGTTPGAPGGGGVPGGGAPGGGVSPGSPDPVGILPLPGTGSGGGPGEGVPGEEGLPGDGTVPGDGVAPVGVGGVPGEEGLPGDGTVPGDAVPPGGVGAVGVGGVPGDPGAGAGGVGPNGVGGEGVIGGDTVGAAQGDSVVIGSDGMIGTGPGGLDAEGLDGGFGAGGFGAGDTGATGFVGADDAATDAAASPAGGFPVAGGSGGGRPEREQHRQAWMAEDADIWEGEADVSPSLISS